VSRDGACPGPERRLRLGLALGGGSGPDALPELLRRAKEAEALGLHSVWLPEMHFRPGAMSAPLVVLAAVAARTRRLRLGTTSLLLPIHPPDRIAAEVAALDQLSGGRVELGLGRGFAIPVLRSFGVPSGRKRDRFDEALDRILSRWDDPTGDPSWRPLQRPHPPLAVAAFGPKGLRQAARRGLPYLASPLETLPRLEENHALHRRELAEGVDPAALPVPVMRTALVVASAARGRALREALAAEQARTARALPAALARVSQGAATERVLVGTAAEVRDEVARYRRRLGMDLLVVRPGVPGATAAEQQEGLERLVHDVLPAFG